MPPSRSTISTTYSSALASQAHARRIANHQLHCLHDALKCQPCTNAMCAGLARQCALAPQHSFPHRDAPQCISAIRQPMHHTCAHHTQASSTCCTAPITCHPITGTCPQRIRCRVQLFQH
jgi:hypothetical protein